MAPELPPSPPSPESSAQHAQTVEPHPTSFGAFKPEGHVLLCLPDGQAREAAQAALQQAGVPAADIRAYTDQDMLQQAEADLARASAVADFGQELNLLRFHRESSLAGCHWLLVKVPGEDEARRIAGLAEAQGATLAQYYGRFLIVELIQAPREEPQRTESPARGLDPGPPRDSSEQP